MVNLQKPIQKVINFQLPATKFIKTDYEKSPETPNGPVKLKDVDKEESDDSNDDKEKAKPIKKVKKESKKSKEDEREESGEY